ncbi:unnamed protein product, partial [Phaeothamnion confervicola]
AEIWKQSGSAIYLLSFWHYGIYFLASYFAAVTLRVVKRDAILMKSVSLAALLSVYVNCPPNALSIGVVAAGFLLNTAGALALGSDRTYYGQEIENLPYRKITSFPYSVMPHPMLAGNIMAFGGTMINADFAREWWPLASTHVALNLGLLQLENCLSASRRNTVGAHAPAIEFHSSVISIAFTTILVS